MRKYIPLLSRKCYPVVKLLPVEFVIELTYRCNIECKFCFMKNGNYLNKRELSERQIVKLILDIVKLYKFSLFKPKIVLTGGEPFCRKDIVRIIKIITTSGLDVHVLTNGTLLNKKIFESLRNLDRKKISFEFSINGNEQSDTKLRGEGNYQKTMKSIGYFKQNFKTSINCVLTKDSIDSVHDIIRFAKSNHINLIFQHLMINCSYQSLNYEKSLNLYDMNYWQVDEKFKIKIKELYDENDGTYSFMPRIKDIGKYYDNKSYGKCNSIFSSIRISPSGNVSPCSNMIIGNITDGELRIILKSVKLDRMKKGMKNRTQTRCTNSCRLIE